MFHENGYVIEINPLLEVEYFDYALVPLSYEQTILFFVVCDSTWIRNFLS